MITYKANYEESPKHRYTADIRKLKSSEVPEHNILLAGFPCQPYSIAGLRLGLEDDRGNVFKDLLRIIRKSKPEAFLLENVKGITAHDKGETLKYIIKTLNKIGYKVKYKTLNSSTHANIPQNRERVFIVGFKSEVAFDKFKFPEPVKLTVNFRNLLEKKINKKYVYDDRFECYGELKKAIINTKSVYQWRRQYVRENKSGVCPTLTANMGSGGHNVPIIYRSGKIRKLTPRECARLQGYPDSFKLPEISDSSLYHQLGNSVTVPLIKRLADEIISAINK